MFAKVSKAILLMVLRSLWLDSVFIRLSEDFHNVSSKPSEKGMCVQGRSWGRLHDLPFPQPKCLKYL